MYKIIQVSELGHLKKCQPSSPAKTAYSTSANRPRAVYSRFQAIQVQSGVELRRRALWRFCVFGVVAAYGSAYGIEVTPCECGKNFFIGFFRVEKTDKKSP